MQVSGFIKTYNKETVFSSVLFSLLYMDFLKNESILESHVIMLFCSIMQSLLKHCMFAKTLQLRDRDEYIVAILCLAVC